MHRSQLNIDYKVKDKPWNYKTFRRKYRGIASWCCSVTKLCLSLWDPKDFSTPGSPVLNYLLEFAQTHVHWADDAIQPSHPLSPLSPAAFHLSQHQGLFQGVDSFKMWCWRGLFKSPLDSKEIKPVNPKENQSWIFIGRTDAEAETPVLWLSDAKGWLIGKDPDPGKDWEQEVKGVTEDEMVGWHHQLIGHEFELTLSNSEGQGSQVCCSPWGFKESYMTEQLNNNVITCDWGDSFISPYCVPGMC